MPETRLDPAWPGRQPNYTSAFVEREKATGNLRRYLDEIGLKSAMVASAGMAP